MNKIFALLSVLLAITYNPAISQDTLAGNDIMTAYFTLSDDEKK